MAQRIQMFSSHLSQTVHLTHPEYPKVFTNFENQFGEYSLGYEKAKADFKIIAKLQKNPLNYDMIIQYIKSGEYDVLHYRRATHITEEYGYGKIDCLQNKSEGDTVHENEYLYKTPNYDEEGNFGYGVNLKAAYIPWKGLTYEDRNYYVSSLNAINCWKLLRALDTLRNNSNDWTISSQA